MRVKVAAQDPLLQKMGCFSALPTRDNIITQRFRLKETEINLKHFQARMKIKAPKSKIGITKIQKYDGLGYFSGRTCWYTWFRYIELVLLPVPPTLIVRVDQKF